MTNDEARALHVFYDDDSEEYWVAYDLDDVAAVIDEAQGEDAFFENYGGTRDDWTQLDDAATKGIRFTGEPDSGLTNMATEDDDPEGCIVVTKTWGEWAKLNGRGFFGGGRS